MGVLKQIQRLSAQAVKGDQPASLIRALSAGVPAARRIGAIGLGRLGKEAHVSILWEQLDREPCATVRTALGLALLQGGANEQEVDRVCRRSIRLRTMSGFRRLQVEPLADLGGMVSLGPKALRERVDQEPDQAGEALLALSLYQYPEDLSRVELVRLAGGRRTEHLCLEALGWLGQPESLPRLKDALSEFDVDPGRGFARRRVAAVALGRMGLPESWRVLSRALKLEASEHEGRPGAGMGLQFPVRSAILWGLGELQAQRCASVLCTHLGAVSDSALGGLHLPAMEALWKLGEAAETELYRALKSPRPLVAVHAACVLEALGKPEELQLLAQGVGRVSEEASSALLHQ
ncbi:MAG: hypothetical protein VX519_07335 [Myxococcota bacterium]|nr:hypothetical protein [Myxococcota bacterium]